METNQIGAGRHTDYGNITLLLTDGTPGLEVQSREGERIAPHQIDDAFICNIGDCLMRWFNDVCVSTPHRVQIPDKKRYFIAFFLDPNSDAVVEVLDTCTSAERPAKYPPVSGADYLRQKLDASRPSRIEDKTCLLDAALASGSATNFQVPHSFPLSPGIAT